MSDVHSNFVSDTVTSVVDRGDGDVVMKTVNGDIAEGGADGGGSMASREEEMEEGKTVSLFIL